MIVASARRVAGSAAGRVFVGRGLAQGGIFVVSVGPVLVLDDATFNTFTVALTLVVLVVLAPTISFQQHLAREHLALHEAWRGVRLSLVMALALAVVASAVSILLQGRNGWAWSIALGGVALALAGWTTTVLALRGRFLHSATVEAVGGVAMALVALVLVARSASVEWFAADFAAAGALSLLVGLCFIGRSSTPTQEPSPHAAQLLHGALPLLAIGFLAMAYNRVDLLILDQVGPDSATTSYAIAGRMVGPLLIGLGSLNNSLYPQLLRSRDDPAHMVALSRRYARLLTAASAVAVPCIALAIWVLGSLSTTVAELDLVVPTTLLALAVVPYAAAIPHAFMLTAIGAERWWMWVLFGAIVLDAIIVVAFAHGSAAACALAWVFVQCLVFVAVTIITRVRSAPAMIARA